MMAPAMRVPYTPDAAGEDSPAGFAFKVPPAFLKTSAKSTSRNWPFLLAEPSPDGTTRGCRSKFPSVKSPVF